MSETSYEDQFLNAEPEGADAEELQDMAEQAVPAEDEGPEEVTSDDEQTEEA